MIPKNGYRFSEKIMLQQSYQRYSRPRVPPCEWIAVAEAAVIAGIDAGIGGEAIGGHRTGVDTEAAFGGALDDARGEVGRG